MGEKVGEGKWRVGRRRWKRERGERTYTRPTWGRRGRDWTSPLDQATEEPFPVSHPR